MVVGVRVRDLFVVFVGVGIGLAASEVRAQECPEGLVDGVAECVGESTLLLCDGGVVEEVVCRDGCVCDDTCACAGDGGGRGGGSDGTKAGAIAEDDTSGCYGSCGSTSPSGCYCDDLCILYGDCCEDFADACPDIYERASLRRPPADTCNGVTFEGECIDNVVHWCEPGKAATPNTLHTFDCDLWGAECGSNEQGLADCLVDEECGDGICQDTESEADCPDDCPDATEVGESDEADPSSDGESDESSSTSAAVSSAGEEPDDGDHASTAEPDAGCRTAPRDGTAPALWCMLLIGMWARRRRPAA